MAAVTMSKALTRYIRRLPTTRKLVITRRMSAKGKRDSVNCKKEGEGESSTKCGGRFQSFPCGKPKMQLEKKAEEKSEKNKKFVSMWENPFCLKQPCAIHPRFDDLYYVESDKAKRLYWQTWVSCPKMRIKPKKVCNFQSSALPPPRRRDPKKKAEATAREVCPKEANPGCIQLKRKCAREGRRPPKCSAFTKDRDCTKPLPPYPAFSECLRLKPGELPLSECLCWAKPMMCEAWAEFRRRNMHKKK